MSGEKKCKEREIERIFSNHVMFHDSAHTHGIYFLLFLNSVIFTTIDCNHSFVLLFLILFFPFFFWFIECHFHIFPLLFFCSFSADKVESIYDRIEQTLDTINKSETCSLRRTRSLAVIREETFNDLQIGGGIRSRRSQLIPRAKLLNRSFFQNRYKLFSTFIFVHCFIFFLGAFKLGNKKWETRSE